MISHHNKIGYNINVLQQTACSVVNPITMATLLISLIAPWWVGLLPVRLFYSGIQFNLLLSPPYLCFISFLYLDLYVLGDDAMIS